METTRLMPAKVGNAMELYNVIYSGVKLFVRILIGAAKTTEHISTVLGQDGSTASTQHQRRGGESELSTIGRRA